MSIQWTIAATFLYFEIAIVLLLVLPIATPRSWQKIFRSRILTSLGSQTQFYFYILLFTLVLLLLDAIREMRKYTNADVQEQTHTSHHLEMQANVRLFRAQRNFYISGFALFLSLVIRRLVILISSLSTMQAQSEASLRQAQSATSTARNLLSQTGEASQNSTNEAHDQEVNDLKAQITSLKQELAKEKKDKEAVKSQAEATNKEYDRLTAEFSKLQKHVPASSSGDKKDD